ncbi:fluoroacetate dehalogenase [Skermanella stibiiresistens SB22]|uniref:Fluoroacetate dehalogenase n=1 Tax=Skermanella stibiiresistens SB22 TaxID=1385369 RepID=W9H0D6_9PROT|nr:alpha/beta hydrolase [Skermanella stibiiresistens]EWY38157.1 fluoroacetate dehalogenase [Skermanella stibiiresistens SB22]
MFEGFTRRRIATSGAEINLVVGGDGPPLLLLHGFPQSHVMWHKVAGALAERFTVVAPDLRGYGDSEKVATAEDHSSYSKREMARDQVEVMRILGFERFQLVGHDRGGRVAHRMAVDHADRVKRLAVLDIVPTLTTFESVDQQLASAYYHWFFLIQPHPLPEHMIGLDPEFYLRRKTNMWGVGTAHFTAEAMAEYIRCFKNPSAIHAMCEDYRAAATIDLEHDRADRAAGVKVRCPLLALWGGRATMDRSFDVLATWRDVALDVQGQAIDCGHYIPEERPEEFTAALLDFLEP